jgi:putative DNA-invertase from lambdoid prophage Rac
MIDLGGDVRQWHQPVGVHDPVCVAEAERDRTRERIAEMKRDQRSRGRFLGGSVPFGWKLGDKGELEAVQEQQAAIERMCELRDGGLSLRAIRDQLADEGVTVSHVAVGNALKVGAWWE